MRRIIHPKNQAAFQAGMMCLLFLAYILYLPLHLASEPHFKVAVEHSHPHHHPHSHHDHSDESSHPESDHDFLLIQSKQPLLCFLPLAPAQLQVLISAPDSVLYLLDSENSSPPARDPFQARQTRGPPLA